MPSTRDLRHLRLASAFLLHFRRRDVAAANGVLAEFIDDPDGTTRFLNAMCTLADFALTEFYGGDELEAGLREAINRMAAAELADDDPPPHGEA